MKPQKTIITKTDIKKLQNTIKVMNYKSDYFIENSQFPTWEEISLGTNLSIKTIQEVETTTVDWTFYKEQYRQLANKVLHSLAKRAMIGDVKAIELFLKYNDMMEIPTEQNELELNLNINIVGNESQTGNEPNE